MGLKTLSNGQGNAPPDMPPLGHSDPDSSPKSPWPVGAVSLWKLSQVLYWCLSHKWESDPKNSCAMCGCSNS
jgi:hypothetical protein